MSKKHDTQAVLRIDTTGNKKDETDEKEKNTEKKEEEEEEEWIIQLALREWCDLVPYHGHGEFRGFVNENKLNAITQYHSHIYYPQLDNKKNEILNRINTFFKQIVDYIPLDAYVIDFLLFDQSIDDNDEKDEKENKQQKKDNDSSSNMKDNINSQSKKWDVALIELNPFYTSAGAGLFSWKQDRELFLNGPCQLRIATPDTIKKLEMFGQWGKLFDSYKTGVENTASVNKNAQQKPRERRQSKGCIIL